MRIYAKKVQFFLVNSKKSSTFARFFARRGERVALSPLIGAPENLSIFGESESKARIHMSDVVANRIEPSLARSPGGGIGRRVGLKHQWETVPVRSRPWVQERRFKRKFDKTGVVKELRRRQQFDKPSELKRVKMAHAKYVQSLHAHDDM